MGSCWDMSLFKIASFENVHDVIIYIKTEIHKVVSLISCNTLLSPLASTRGDNFFSILFYQHICYKYAYETPK